MMDFKNPIYAPQNKWLSNPNVTEYQKVYKVEMLTFYKISILTSKSFEANLQNCFNKRR